MTFLSVYDAIWDFLEEEDILDGIVSEVEDFFGEKTLSKYEDSPNYPDIILEYALFNHIREDKPLIEYVSEHLADSLNEKDKEQFLLLLDTRRKNFKFSKKIKRNDTDARGKELYDFYFTDVDSGETKIVVSSSEIDRNPPEVNIRLIRNPHYAGERYNIIGLICNHDYAEHLTALNTLKELKRNFDLASGRKTMLFEMSRKLSFEEIDSFEDKNSSFIKQDRIIMKLNKQFYERFKMNLDDFSNNVFELSNDRERFKDMCEHYLPISKELEDAIYNTNYGGGIKFISYGSVLKSFLGFILDDFELLEKGIAELQQEAKDDFERVQNNDLSMTRERIMEREKGIIKEIIGEIKASKDNLAKETIEEYSSFLRRIDEFKPEDIGLFLTEIIGFLNKKKNHLINPEGGNISELKFRFKLDFLEDLRDNCGEILYIADIKEERGDTKFEPEEFYEYFSDISDEMYDLMKLLYAAYLFSKKEHERAYSIIKESNIEKNYCFSGMFFMGKVLSMFENDEYRGYFNQAKRIDKSRYKDNLERFLAWKNNFKQNEIKMGD